MAARYTCRGKPWSRVASATALATRVSNGRHGSFETKESTLTYHVGDTILFLAS